MYLDYFGLSEKPFSIAPDPAYLFMSARHKEAMAHLSYGLSQGGCFIVLTGEVGTGKTTLCRNLLKDLPANIDVALILNANVGEDELLATICDELKINYAPRCTQKQLLDAINLHLLRTFSQNRQTVLMIDEAQLLSPKVLEQIRLLTNLETTKHKLLQIMLIGQPELNDLLSRNDLRQLAQRVTARYHLGEIKASEIEDYINHRLSVAGCRQPLFSRQALKQLHVLSDGIPRKINVLADHSLLSAYAANQNSVDSNNVRAASKEVFVQTKKGASKPKIVLKPWMAIAAGLLIFNGLAWWWFANDDAVKSGSPGVFSDSTIAESRVTEANIAEPGDESASTPLLNNQNGEPIETDSVETASLAGDDAPPSTRDDRTLNEDEVGQLRPAVNNESELTTIVRSPDIQPGSVVISDDFLDDSAPQVEESLLVDNTVATASLNAVISRSTVPAYDLNSEFGKVLDSSADVTGRTLAFRNLAQAWDASLPTPLIRSACDSLAQEGIACLVVRSWRELERFNRPSIMVLRQGDQLHRVIVFKLDGDDAQVLVGNEVHTVSQSELRARWNNNGITFWRPGDVGQQLLRQADANSQIPLVRQRLNQTFTALNMPLLDNETSNRFDPDMAQKIFALQSLFAISADSMVGPETYLLMNELLRQQETPILRERVKRG